MKIISDYLTYKACKKYKIQDYKINKDGSIDVNGNVDLGGERLTKIPIKFNRVSGHFNCAYNRITSLEGCPKYVGDYFRCTSNEITTLIGGPKVVGGDFYCQDNFIMDVKGFPENYYGNAYFVGNPINELFQSIPFSEKCVFINLLNEYDVIRNNGKTIIRDRLEAAYEGIGMELPDDEEIYGYEII